MLLWMADSQASVHCQCDAEEWDVFLQSVQELTTHMMNMQKRFMANGKTNKNKKQMRSWLVWHPSAFRKSLNIIMHNDWTKHVSWYGNLLLTWNILFQTWHDAHGDNIFLMMSGLQHVWLTGDFLRARHLSFNSSSAKGSMCHRTYRFLLHLHTNL